MTPEVYAFLFTCGILAWPFLLIEEASSGRWFTAALLLNTAFFAFAWLSCSTKSCSYWNGLKMVSASMMTGCANITIFVLPPVLLYVFLFSVGVSIVGLWKGREWKHERWERMIVGFYNHRLRK